MNTKKVKQRRNKEDTKLDGCEMRLSGSWRSWERGEHDKKLMYEILKD